MAHDALSIPELASCVRACNLFRKQIVIGPDFDAPLPGFEDLGG